MSSTYRFDNPVSVPAPTASSHAVPKSTLDSAISGVTTSSIGAQPADSDLTTIAGLTPTDCDMLRRESGLWVAKSMAQIKTALSLAKSDVGLGNVDNTSDANKPISTATQTALDAKLTTAIYTHGGALVGGATTVNTASTSYITLGSNDLSTTFTFPPSGTLTILIRTSISCSSTTLNHFGMMSFEVRDTNVSGTVRCPPGDDYAAFSQSITAAEALGTTCCFVTFSGFPTSGTGYIRGMYRSANASNTATFAYRSITVIPSP